MKNYDDVKKALEKAKNDPLFIERIIYACMISNYADSDELGDINEYIVRAFEYDMPIIGGKIDTETAREDAYQWVREHKI